MSRDIEIVDPRFDDPASITLTPAARHWPDDERIMEAIHLHIGGMELVAAALGLTVSSLSRYIARPENRHLKESQRKTQAAADALAQRAIARGCQLGDRDMIQLRMRQQIADDVRKAAGIGMQSAGGPIDFTREVKDISEFSDSELVAAVLAREGVDPPEPGCKCPLCGSVAAGVPEMDL